VLRTGDGIGLSQALADRNDQSVSEERGLHEKGLDERGTLAIGGILGGENDALAVALAGDPLDLARTAPLTETLDDDHHLTSNLEVVSSVSAEKVANRTNTRELLDGLDLHGDNFLPLPCFPHPVTSNRLTS
jgi:hypothetical protein